ncbi:MAG: hypothetical protein QM698_12510 [Micropepsaceae bacterium]
MRIAVALFLAAAVIWPAQAEMRDFADPAAGFSLKLPEAWTDPAGGVTTSADGSVRCTATGQPVPQTAAMTQEQVNATMQAYTADIWKSRFLTGGVTGSIDHSGITKMEQYDAPWARERLNYPNGAAAKFGVIMLSAPGKLASLTCLADPAAYDSHLADITNLLNWLRPL